MKSRHRKSSQGASNPNPPPLGELVVQNGRLGGARRALSAPITLIGRDESCQIRLNVDGVATFHCALIQGPQGVLLRNLHSQMTTLVNGEPSDNCLLRNDDMLAVGPFRFRIRLPHRSEDPGSKAGTSGSEDASPGLQREREALRIQAAAVAAQQAALAEEETRLQQRRVALEQQEKQLAKHLEDKRRQIIHLHRQTRQERTELLEQRKTYEQRIGAATSDLVKERKELAEVWEQNQVMRKRLVNLHRRLRQRWHRHWMAERQAQKQHEKELAHQRLALEKEAARLQQERDALDRMRLRVNGECDLSRRQLKASWKEFQKARAEWQDQHGRDKRERKDKDRQLAQRKAELARSERELEDEKQKWQSRRLYLEKEAEGLENRIRNHRRKILDQEQEVVRLESVIRASLATEPEPASPQAPNDPGQIPDAAPLAVPDTQAARAEEPECPDVARGENLLRAAEDEVRQRLDTLDKLSGELADQRLHVTEQWERLLQTRESWERDHDAAAAELEAMTLRLQKREQGILNREGVLARGEQTLRQRLSEVLQVRQNLEGCQVRLRAHVKAWEADRDRLATEMRAREKLADHRLVAIEGVRKRWEKRRRQELHSLKSNLDAAEKIRKEFLALREDWLGRSQELEKQEREVAERKLAVEQYRKESICQSANSAAGEKHLERLRRQWAALSQAAERNLGQSRQALQAELDRLEERYQEWNAHAHQVAARETRLAELQTALEAEQARVKDKYNQMRQRVQILLAQRDRYESQITSMQEEIERVAQLLLDDQDTTQSEALHPNPQTIVQAA
jgi:pSer/pThr/pTyr-binding forkhead associated (FHA) protein